MSTNDARRYPESGTGSRPSGLWGLPRPAGTRKTRRRSIVALIALFAVAVPFVATAGTGSAPAVDGSTYVAPELTRAAADDPNSRLSVIVQSADGAAAAASAVADASGRAGAGQSKQLDVVGGVAATLPGNRLDDLAKEPGVTITPDAPVVLDGKRTARQLWPLLCHCDDLAKRYRRVRPAAIAIVDSGIDSNRADFAGRVAASVNLASLSPNSPGDGYGHGTFVAGIAAGGAPGFTGVAPTAPIVSLDVMNDEGVAKTSDVIRAAQWIIDNKQRYDIGVANFSLHAANPSSFRFDPLDKAIEKLWFSGVVVVTSVGNYGSASGPSGVPVAPANDPFVITVGALDTKSKPGYAYDLAAPWSAYGYTLDGFAKPELAAPGRSMVGPVPPGSTLASEQQGQLVGPGYIELSGTSFAAPVVAGVAAYLRGIHPNWTPDEVKGALMATSRSLPKAAPLSVGVGAIDAGGAAGVRQPPIANLALDRFLVAVPGESVPAFDAVAWLAAAKADPNWDAPTWQAGGWGPSKASVSWSDVSWSDVSWSDVAWSDVSWSDVSWSDVAWSDVTPDDPALGDVDPLP